MPPRVMSPDDGRARAEHATHILLEDPDLAEALPRSERLAAAELLQARVIRLQGPSWLPPALDPSMSYGLLALDGLLARRIRVGRAVATELIGSGEILRPWVEPCLADLVPPTIEWRVLSPARLAILDEPVTRAISAWPQLMIAFSNRLLLRVRHAEYMMAVGHLPRVEQRLLGTLWHLASNWGTVTPRGVQVPFRLTHELLGEVVGARRPSVTLAIRELYRSGQLARDSGGRFLLVGDPSDWAATIRPAGARSGA